MCMVGWQLGSYYTVTQKNINFDKLYSYFNNIFRAFILFLYYIVFFLQKIITII